MHCKSYSHFFSKKCRHICVSLDVNFNESLTNDVVSFEQLGPGLLFTSFRRVLDKPSHPGCLLVCFKFRAWSHTRLSDIVQLQVWEILFNLLYDLTIQYFEKWLSELDRVPSAHNADVVISLSFITNHIYLWIIIFQYFSSCWCRDIGDSWNFVSGKYLSRECLLCF